MQAREGRIESDRIDTAQNLPGGKVPGYLQHVGYGVIGDSIGTRRADRPCDNLECPWRADIARLYRRIVAVELREITKLVDAQLMIIGAQENNVIDVIVGEELE